MGSNMEIFEARVLGGMLVLVEKSPILRIVSCLHDLYVGFEILVSLSHTLKNYC